ncbi:MAG TPA: type I-C CRISPR-associated protein Cas5c [Sedimentibacter sp.]|nr:type I-C CRISPR-associated protein Cas5c [Sedimentibacter sp.]HQK53862.1 type I-C CRISPR-associated protein Cas5c [Sedimentibacter sp.]
MSDFRSEPFYMKVCGDYALFTDPMTKGGGEKFSYQVPTYQALKGISEACYWKPTFYYIIDSVKVMKKIRTETKSILTLLKNGEKDLSYYTYLRDVEYLVKFHFAWNENRCDLEYDRNEKKHEQILLRSMARGGRRDVFLGTRECIGYIMRIKERDYEEAKSCYYGEKISMGIMFHSFSYPDETYRGSNENVLVSNFCSIVMEDGIIQFKEPKDCEIKHMLGNYSIKKFNKENFTTADEVLLEYERIGVSDNELDVRSS